MRLVPLLSVLILGAVFPVFADLAVASPIALIRYQTSGGSLTPMPQTGVSITVGFGGDLFRPTFSRFGDLVLTPGDKGKKFTLNSATDPDFSQVVSFLTNGINEFIQFAVLEEPGGGGGASMSPESFWFFNDRTGSEGTDLHGVPITAVSLQLEALNIDATPDADGLYNYSVRFILIFESPVSLSAALAELTDSDGDGVPDVADKCSTTPAGLTVDSEGCSLDQFCSGFEAKTPIGRATCRKADWKNDEPLMKPAKEADCSVQKGRPGFADDTCAAAPGG